MQLQPPPLPDRQPEALPIRKERTGFILAIALCDTAALFGLVVYFVTGSPRAWVYMAIGLVGLLVHRPKLPPHS